MANVYLAYGVCLCWPARNDVYVRIWICTPLWLLARQCNMSRFGYRSDSENTIRVSKSWDYIVIVRSFWHLTSVWATQPQIRLSIVRVITLFRLPTNRTASKHHFFRSSTLMDIETVPKLCENQLGPFLLTWINFNLSMDKKSHAH